MLNGLVRLGAVAMALCLSATAPQAAPRHRAHTSAIQPQTLQALQGLQVLQGSRAPQGTASRPDRIGNLVRSVEGVVVRGEATASPMAIPVIATDDAAADVATVHAATVGDVTRVPYGWADFCTRRPEECRVDVLDPVTVVATPRVMRVLAAANAEANAEIEPISNLEHWGTLLDHWDYPLDGKGDCKIYALWKRKLLLDRGFPRQALLMTIVRDLEGNGHTILTVKTDRGDFILDNMVGEIRPWDATGYKFVKRQSQADPNVWVSIGPTPAPATTAGLN